MSNGWKRGDGAPEPARLSLFHLPESVVEVLDVLRAQCRLSKPQRLTLIGACNKLDAAMVLCQQQWKTDQVPAALFDAGLQSIALHVLREKGDSSAVARSACDVLATLWSRLGNTVCPTPQSIVHASTLLASMRTHESDLTALRSITEAVATYASCRCRIGLAIDAGAAESVAALLPAAKHIGDEGIAQNVTLALKRMSSSKVPEQLARIVFGAGCVDALLAVLEHRGHERNATVSALACEGLANLGEAVRRGRLRPEALEAVTHSRVPSVLVKALQLHVAQPDACEAASRAISALVTACPSAAPTFLAAGGVDAMIGVLQQHASKPEGLGAATSACDALKAVAAHHKPGSAVETQLLAADAPSLVHSVLTCAVISEDRRAILICCNVLEWLCGIGDSAASASACAALVDQELPEELAAAFTDVKCLHDPQCGAAITSLLRAIAASPAARALPGMSVLDERKPSSVLNLGFHGLNWHMDGSCSDRAGKPPAGMARFVLPAAAASCGFVRNLAMTPGLRPQLIEAGAHGWIVRCWKKVGVAMETESGLTFAACSALLALACDPGCCAELYRYGAHHVAFGALDPRKELHTEERIAWVASGLILKLAQGAPEYFVAVVPAPASDDLGRLSESLYIAIRYLQCARRLHSGSSRVLSATHAALEVLYALVGLGESASDTSGGSEA